MPGSCVLLVNIKAIKLEFKSRRIYNLQYNSYEVKNNRNFEKILREMTEKCQKKKIYKHIKY